MLPPCGHPFCEVQNCFALTAPESLLHNSCQACVCLVGVAQTPVFVGASLALSSGFLHEFMSQPQRQIKYKKKNSAVVRPSCRGVTAVQPLLLASRRLLFSPRCVFWWSRILLSIKPDLQRWAVVKSETPGHHTIVKLVAREGEGKGFLPSRALLRTWHTRQHSRHRHSQGSLVSYGLLLRSARGDEACLFKSGGHAVSVLWCLYSSVFTPNFLDFAPSTIRLSPPLAPFPAACDQTQFSF